MSNTQVAHTPVATLLETYRHMVTAREMDSLEQDFTGRGEAFFHVSGAGHEATAALNDYLVPEDYLHVHYRDKALMLARGISPKMFFLALFNKDESHSRGRQMNAHMSAPELNILSLVGPVGNSALHAAGVAEVIKEQPANPIVLCALGDGMTQQGEVHEAIGHAVRDSLPVLFVVEDNAFAISTGTKRKTFYSNPNGEAESFYGVPIERVDGRDPLAAHEVFSRVVGDMRRQREPRIVVFQVDRLQNHTNADDQRVYRTPEEIEQVNRIGDPIRNLGSYLLQSGITQEQLDDIQRDVKTDLAAVAAEAQRSADPTPYRDAKRPLSAALTDPRSEYLGSTDSSSAGPRLTMIESIRGVLRHRLSTDESVTLFGEDIEDPKGDVFGVTKGLTQAFPGRVINSPLSESTILGVSIGRALAGEHPVAFLQFADFLPIAYNQIFAELGSMYWRTDGGWQVPVIVMITCGGYRPGLGPFHASSLEAIAAHTPGVDVFMPSSAADAAGLLNAAFESKRPTLFFYPKNCLNDRAKATSPDVDKHLVPVGSARLLRSGEDITLLGWGNTVALCEKAAASLAEEGVSAEVVDLRSLVPWDQDLVVSSVEKTGRLLVAHEDNHTVGLGAEIAATVSETASRHVSIRRVTRPDTYVPCNFENQLQVLPSYRSVLETAVELLGGEIVWRAPESAAKGVYLVEAIGSSPSDESISVVEWKVENGDVIESGQIIAEIEADKASAELRAPVSGTVDELLIDEGDMVKVGTPIARMKTGAGDAEEHLKPVTKEDPGTPLITGIEAALEARATTVRAGARSTGGAAAVGIGGIATAFGGRVVSNEEISEMCPTWSAEDIVKRTGIESRRWVTDDQDALSLAVDAVESLFSTSGITVRDIDMIVCSTGTPILTTPAMAAMVHDKIAGSDRDHRIQAYDINAACSGYLYGLQIAYDYLQSRPEHKVLLITTEALSPKLDSSDPATAPIFGDAATATLVGVPDSLKSTRFEVHRPVLSAQGENGDLLRVPADPNDVIFMDGPRVFQAAVKDMIVMLRGACEEAGVTVEGLDLIVPHQANQRIINAIRQRIKAPKEKMFSNIRAYGNTSSNTIPICLAEIAEQDRSGQHLGLTAFGGGFTFGGGVLRVR